MQTNIPAEITDITYRGLKLRVNGAQINLTFTSGYTNTYWIELDGFYLVFEHDEDVLLFLRAVNEDNRELLVLSKLISIMWHEYSRLAIQRLLRQHNQHGEVNAVRFLRSVYLSLTHKRLYRARDYYEKIRGLLPEAWSLFKSEGARRYVAKLMDFEINLIAYGLTR